MKKRSLLSLLLSVLLILLFALLAGCHQAEPETGDLPDSEDTEPLEDAQKVSTVQVGMVVDGAVVNIRIEPSTEGRILDTVQRGALLEVVSGPEAGWYEVRCRGDIAYVNADYLYVSEWLTDKPVTVGTVTGSDAVNVRQTPSTSGNILFTAAENDQFIVLQANSSEGWHQVSYRGGSAYISTEYLTLTEATIGELLYGE